MKVFSIMLLMSVAALTSVNKVRSSDLSKVDLAQCYQTLSAFSHDIKDAFLLKSIAEHIKTLTELKKAGLLTKAHESALSKIIELYMQHLDQQIIHDVSQEHLQAFLDELQKVSVEIANVVSALTQKVKENAEPVKETAKSVADKVISKSQDVAAQAANQVKETISNIVH